MWLLWKYHLHTQSTRRCAVTAVGYFNTAAMYRSDGLDRRQPQAQTILICIKTIKALAKLREARARIDAWIQAGGHEIVLQVDGGVKIDNIAEIRRAGADTFVAGSAIFGKPDYPGIIKSMREQIAIGETTAV